MQGSDMEKHKTCQNCQNSDKFGYSFVKKNIMLMYILCIYKKKSIIVRLFKTDTLNLTMYILTILTCPLKKCIIGLHSPPSMHIFFTIKGHSFSL